MELQRYKKKYCEKPEKHLLKTAKDTAPLFLLQATIHIRVCKNTIYLTPRVLRHSKTRMSGHAKTRVSDDTKTRVSDICRYANPVNSLRKGKAFLLKEAKTSGQNSRKRQAAKTKNRQNDTAIRFLFAISAFCNLQYSDENRVNNI